MANNARIIAKAVSKPKLTVGKKLDSISIEKPPMIIIDVKYMARPIVR